MTSAQRSRRARFRRLAAAAVASAQFAVAAFAPALDARDGLGAPAHVESQGVELHFTHNPDNCAACLAQTLVSVAPLAARPVVASESVAPVVARDAPAAFVRIDWRPNAPRAPPISLGARSSF